MDFNEDELDHFFSNIVVPEGTKHNHGFLEIIGKESHENTWSKLYAHFLEDLCHSGKYPFLEALLVIIEKKTNRTFRMKTHEPSTEVWTGSGRIDLVVEDRESQKYIIIENKVYHHLNNDLLNYWNHFKVPDENKVGILLALSETQIPADVAGKFVCITHAQWLAEIENYYTSDGPIAEQDVYLRDFIQTVKQITHNRVMTEQSAFFFRHAAEVNAAIATRQAAEQYIQSQYAVIADKLGLQLFGDELERRNYWDEGNGQDIYFTLNLEGLFAGKGEIEIIIELYREALKKHEVLRKQVENEPQFKNQYMITDWRVVDSFMHFCYRKYPVLASDVARFSDFVVEKIQSDFGALFVKLIRSYSDYSSHNISAWEKRVNPK